MTKAIWKKMLLNCFFLTVQTLVKRSCNTVYIFVNFVFKFHSKFICLGCFCYFGVAGDCIFSYLNWLYPLVYGKTVSVRKESTDIRLL